MAILTSLQVLSCLSLLIAVSGQEVCNSFPNSPKMGQYKSYRNNDYYDRHVEFVDLNNTRLVFKVRAPAQVTKIVSSLVDTGEQLFNCIIEKEEDKGCCIHKTYEGEFNISESCLGDYMVYNRVSTPNYYLLIYEIIQGSADWTNHLVWFSLLVNGRELDYFSTHSGRNPDVVCPQFAQSGHQTSSTALLTRLSRQQETHKIQYEDLEKRVPLLEFSNLTLNVLGFATDVHLYSFWLVYSFREMDLFQLQEVQVDEELKNLKSFEKDFSLRMQWHPEYEQFVRQWKHTVQVNRHVIAILLVIHDYRTFGATYLTNLLEEWVVQDRKDSIFHWPDGQQYPAIRLIGLEMRREAVFDVGQDKLLWIDIAEMHNTTAPVCYKRYSKSEEYILTKRMKCLSRIPYCSISNLRTTDSGMYRCRNPPNVKPSHNFIEDYYIIVLPHKDDVYLLLTVQPVQIGARLVNDYPFIDVRLQPYFHKGVNVYISCVFLLSKGLDNFRGYSIYHSSRLMPTLKQNWTTDSVDQRLTVHSYEIAPPDDDSVVVNEFRCIHHYQPLPDVVKHHKALSESRTRIVKSTVLISDYHNTPKIIQSTIHVVDSELFTTLNNTERNMSSLFEQPAIVIQKGMTLEGSLRGSFISLFSRKDGWCSLFAYLSQSDSKSSNSQTTEDKVLEVNCMRRTTPISIHPGDTLYESPEMKQSDTLNAFRCTFECVLVTGMSGIMLGAFDRKASKISRSEVELKVNKRVRELLTNQANSVLPSQTNPIASIYGSVHLIRLDVRWPGTLEVGDTLHMVWRPMGTRLDKFTCFHSIDMTSRQFQVSPLLIDMREFFDEHVMQISKVNLTEEDSGLYWCDNCPKCDEIRTGMPRRLVVLPNRKKMMMAVQSVGMNHTGAGEFEDPIRTNAKDIMVTCSYKLYAGIEAMDSHLNLTHVTGIPNSEHHLALSVTEMTRTIDSFDKYTHYITTGFIHKPEEYEYWNYTRVQCELHIRMLKQDKNDYKRSDSEFVLNKTVYFHYNLTRGPDILYKLINTSNIELTEALKRPYTFNMIDMLKSFNGKDSVRIPENIYSIEFIMFPGVPRGSARVWAISHVIKGLRVITECVQTFSSPVDKSKTVLIQLSDTKYPWNTNEIFEEEGYECLLDIHTEFLVFVAIGRQPTRLSLNATEQLFRQIILNTMSNMDGESEFRVDVEADVQLLESTATSFRTVRLDVHWPATVFVGENVTMLGHAPPPNSQFQCFTRAGSEYNFSLTSSKVKGSLKSGTSLTILEITIDGVKFNASGLYKCNLTRACTQCPPRFGLMERQLLVLPRNNRVLLLQLMLDKQIGGVFNQMNATTNTPYLFPKQSAIVLCAHEQSNTKLVQPRVDVIYAMIDDHGRRKTLKYIQLPNSQIKKDELQFIVSPFRIRAPNALEYENHLNVTCRLLYKIEHIFGDTHKGARYLEIRRFIRLTVKITSTPYVFAPLIVTNMTELLENWSRGWYNPTLWSSAAFHNSASTKRLLEGIVELHSVQCLGVTEGTSELWMIRESTRNEFNYEECNLTKSETVNQSLLPSEVINHSIFQNTGGRSMYNQTFKCALQAESIALFFITYNAIDESISTDKKSSLIVEKLRGHLHDWMAKPENDKVVDWPVISGLRISYAVVKLHLGWQSLVYVGASWQILIRGYREPVILNVYHQSNGTNQSVLVFSKKSKEAFVWITQNAIVNQSGIYTCNVSGHDPCFISRRLNVVSSLSGLQIHQVRSDYLDTDKELSVNCNYVRPTSFLATEKLHFKYELLTKSNRLVKSLPFVVLPVKAERDSNGTKLSAPFTIRGPEPSGDFTQLFIQCSLQLNASNFDSRDINIDKYTKPIRVNRTIRTRVVLKPVLFKITLETEDRLLQNRFKKSLFNPSDTRKLHHFAPSQLIPEGVFVVNVLASIGVPTGWLYTVVFARNEDKKIVTEFCLVKTHTKIAPYMIPNFVLVSGDYSTLHELSIVDVSFSCPFRVENFALAIIAFSNTTTNKLNNHTMLNQTLQKLHKWLERVWDNPKNIETFKIDEQKGTVATLMMTKLMIGWNASVSMGSKVEMLGYVKNDSYLSSCHKIDSKKKTVPLNDKFKISRSKGSNVFQLVKLEAEYADSGVYSCFHKLEDCTVSCESGYTIVQRRLIVLPNLSLMKMFLTHDRVNKANEWVGNFTHCDAHSRPFLYMGTELYVHCSHTLPPDNWFVPKLKLNVIGVHTPIGNATFNFPIRLIASKKDNGTRELHSSRIRLSNRYDYGCMLVMECIWSYHIVTKRKHDLSNLTKVSLPYWERITDHVAIQLKLVKHIQVRSLFLPQIHSSTVMSDDRVSQKILRNARKPKTESEFKANIIEGEERVIQVHVVISLGIPRGRTDMWTVYQYNNLYIREQCVQQNEVKLTPQLGESNEVHDDRYRRNYKPNVVNMSWACVLRTEQQALLHTVFHLKYNASMYNKSEKWFQSWLLRQTKCWLMSCTKDVDQSDIPLGMNSDFRAIRLNITWKRSLSIGSRLSMLGYVKYFSRKDLKCLLKTHGKKYKHLQSNSRVRTWPTEHRVGFTLIIEELQFTDSGTYVCLHTDPENATQMKNIGDVLEGKSLVHYLEQLSFVPRKLAVEPDDSIMRIYFNHKPTEPPTSNFTQLNQLMQPYLLAGQTARVHCSFIRPHASEFSALIGLTVAMANQTDAIEFPCSNSKIYVDKPTTHMEYTKSCTITAPNANKVTGPLTINCTINFRSLKKKLSITRNLIVEVRVNTVIFGSTIISTKQPITTALQLHLQNPVNTAGQFNLSGPVDKILEGAFKINYTVGLGLPTGQARLFFLYEHEGVIRKRMCGQKESKETVMNSEIQHSDYHLESDGRGIVSYEAMCPLTMNVIGILLTVVNVFDIRHSNGAMLNSFYDSVRRVLYHWFNMAKMTSDEIEPMVQIPPMTSMQYSLIRLRVGWRGIISVNSSFAIYSSWIARSKLVCFYRATEFSERIRIEPTEDEFEVNNVLKLYSMELFKSHASLTDTGIYECMAKNCKECLNSHLFIPHYLTVVPYVIYSDMHYSHSLISQGSHDNHSAWNFTSTNSTNVIPYIYTNQTIMITCDYHISAMIFSNRSEYSVTRTKISNESKNSDWKRNMNKDTPQLNWPNFTFSLNSLDDIDETFPYQFIAEQWTDEENFTAIMLTYAVIGPTFDNITTTLSTMCGLGLDRTELSLVHEINTLSAGDRQLTIDGQLVVHQLMPPSIVPLSVRTDDENVTKSLDQSFLTTAATFHTEFTHRKSLPEGPFNIRFEWFVGQPKGWTGVFSVYNISNVFVHHPCTAINSSNNDEKETNPDSLWVTYSCLLLTEQVGIVIYAVHQSDEKVTVADFDKQFTRMIINGLDQRFKTNTDISITLPAGYDGDFRLCPLPVTWKNIIRIGEPIQFFGILKGDKPINCQHGYAMNNLRPISDQFNQTDVTKEHYFVLRKAAAEWLDSGIYRCLIPNCGDCDRMDGLQSRWLIIKPDVSILTLSIKSLSLADSLGLNCPTGTLMRIEPGQRLNITCSHMVPYSFESIVVNHILSYGIVNQTKSDVEIEQITTTIIFPQNQTRLVLSNQVLVIPRFSLKGETEWYLNCQLPFTPLMVSIYHFDYMSSEPSLKVEQKLNIIQKRFPTINNYRVENLDGQIIAGLQMAAQHPLRGESFLHTGSLQRMEENPYRVIMSSHPGEPIGWSFFRLYYQCDKQLCIDQCSMGLVSRNSNGSSITYRAVCFLHPEHIALLMASVNLPEVNLDHQLVEQQVETLVLQNLTHWLNYDQSVLVDNRTCFGHDYRLIRLRVGWHGTVKTGHSIHMLGRLEANDGLENLVCYHLSKETHTPIPLSSNFSIRSDTTGSQFVLSKATAEIRDMGQYFCNYSNVELESEENNSTDVYLGMMPRQLIVIPTETEVKCNLTINIKGTRQEVNKQQTVFPTAWEMFYLECLHDPILDSLYNLTHGAVYKMNNTETNDLLEMSRAYGPYMESVKIDSGQRVYEMKTPNVSDYKGPLLASCQISFFNLKSKDSLATFDDTFAVQCDRWLDIRERASGDVIIQRMYTDDNVAPLGSGFICKGGYGIPRLTYSWTRLHAPMFSANETKNIMASLLPADRGGWGGPSQPFEDSPERDLQTNGALLQIPDDPSYRGMSYAYVCNASNVVDGKTYSISRSILLTVSLCETNRRDVDLIIFSSQRLLSACILSGNSQPDIQFYGHFFLTLMRQVLYTQTNNLGRTRLAIIKWDGKRGKIERPYPFTMNGTEFFQTTVNLYLPNNKPNIIASDCTAPKVDLLRIIMAVNDIYEQGMAKNPVLWLTTDLLLQINEDSKVLSYELYKMRKFGVKVVLALVHPLDKPPFDAFNKRLQDLLHPKHVVTLVPRFVGATQCHKCNLPLESPQIQIRRAPLFEALCLAAGTQLPGKVNQPQLFFSIPPSIWYDGLHIVVTCTTEVPLASSMESTNHLVLCGSTRVLLEQLLYENDSYTEDVSSKKNIWNLDEACQEKLSEKITTVDNPPMLSVTIQLQSNPPRSEVLCYHRLGELSPRLFDAVNFNHESVISISKGIDSPILTFHQTATQFALTRPAQFECLFNGFADNLIALLLFQEKLSQYKGVQQPYRVVAHTRPELNLENVSTVVLLTWMELPEQYIHGRLYCLIQPRDPRVDLPRMFHQLPNESIYIRLSNALEIPAITWGCPEVPILEMNPEQRYPELKEADELVLMCSTTPDQYPLKLIYLTPISATFLCLVVNETMTEIPPTETTTRTNCFFTTPDDEDCTKMANSSHIPDSSHFAHKCESPDFVESIMLTIKQLRITDFSGQMFCESIYPPAVGTEGDPHLSMKLFSPVYTIVFRLKPRVAHFRFITKMQHWQCRVFAYPLSNETQIKLIKVEPMWLRKQLNVYFVSEHRNQPSLQYEHLLPKSAFIVRSQLDYTARLIYRPRITVPGGLSQGNISLKCVISNVSKLLFTKTHGSFGTVHSEDIIPSKHILKVGNEVQMICTIPLADPSMELTHISLHRILQYDWLNFDMTLVSVIPQETRNRSHLFEQLRASFGLFGPWRSYGRTGLRVLTDRSDWNTSIAVTMRGGTEYDSGNYYCTGKFRHGKYVQTSIYNTLFYGETKRIAIGYRASNGPRQWFRQSRPTTTGTRIHVCCIAWTTDPTNRGVNLLELTHETETQLTRHEVWNGKPIVVKAIHYEEPVEQNGVTQRSVQCRMVDRRSDYFAHIQTPHIPCGIPSDLRLEPNLSEGYPRTSVVHCTASHTCNNIRFRWFWRAGPVPQIRITDSMMDFRNVSLGGALFLSKLPSSGVYAFYCTFKCECGQKQLSYPMLFTIVVLPGPEEQNDVDGEVVDNFEDAKIARNESFDNYDGIENQQSEDDQEFEEVVNQTMNQPFVGVRGGASKDMSMQRLGALLEIQRQRSQAASHIFLRDYRSDVIRRARMDDTWVVLQPSMTFLSPPVPPSNRMTHQLNIDPRKPTQLVNEKETLDKVDRLIWNLHSAGRFYHVPNQRIGGFNRRKLSRGLLQLVQNPKLLYPPYLRFNRDILSPIIKSMYDQRLDTSLVLDQGNVKRRVKLGDVPRSKGTGDQYALWLRNRPDVSSRTGWKEHSLPQRYTPDVIGRKVDQTKRYIHQLGYRPAVFGSGGRMFHDGTKARPGVRKRQGRHYIYQKGDKVTDFDMEEVSKDTHEFSSIPKRKQTSMVSKRRISWIGRSEQFNVPIQNGPIQNDYLSGEIPRFTDSSLPEYVKDESILNRRSGMREKPRTDIRTSVGKSTQLDRRMSNAIGGFPQGEYQQDEERINLKQYLDDQKEWNEPLDSYSAFIRTKYPTAVHAQSIQTLRKIRLQHTYENGQATGSRSTSIWNRYQHRKRIGDNSHSISREFGNIRKEGANSVLIEPGLIQLPATVTIYCPMDLTNPISTMVFNTLIWEHTYQYHSYPEPLLAHYIHSKNHIVFNSKFSNPMRLFSYPPYRSSNHYTLDVKPLHVNDFGFFQCVLKYGDIRDTRLSVDVERVATHPLCTIPSQDNPILTVRYVKGSVPQAPDKVWRSNDGKQNITLNRTITKRTCYLNGDIVRIKCHQPIPCKLFCELADLFVNGTRLVNTQFRALLTWQQRTRAEDGSETGQNYKQLSLPDTMRIAIPNELKASVWRITLTHMHDGAEVTCQTSPVLLQSRIVPLKYWDWLRDQFDRNHLKLIRTSQSVSLTICPSLDAIQIEPKPTRIYRLDPTSIESVQVYPGQTVMCSSLQPGLSQPMLLIYRTLHFEDLKGEKKCEKEIENNTACVNVTPVLVDWPLGNWQSQSVVVRVPEKRTSIGYYSAQCSVPHLNLHKNFSIHVRPLPEAEFMNLDVTKIWIAVTMPVMILLYLQLQRFFKNKTRRRLERLASRDAAIAEFLGTAGQPDEQEVPEPEPEPESRELRLVNPYQTHQQFPNRHGYQSVHLTQNYDQA